MWFIGVEVEQETSASPPNKKPGSAPGVNQPRRITPSEISIILQMMRKPNSTIVLLFIQNNS